MHVWDKYVTGEKPPLSLGYVEIKGDIKLKVCSQ